MWLHKLSSVFKFSVIIKCVLYPIFLKHFQQPISVLCVINFFPNFENLKSDLETNSGATDSDIPKKSFCATDFI